MVRFLNNFSLLSTRLQCILYSVQYMRLDQNKQKICEINTKLETPVPVRSLKLSNLGHGYWLVLGWVTIQVLK